MSSVSEEGAALDREDLDALLLDVGQKIAGVRRQRSLTQEQLASRAGCSPNTVIAVESGKRNVTLRSLVLLSSALDVSLADLFGEGETPPEEVSSVVVRRLLVELQDARDIIERMQSMISALGERDCE